MIKNTVHTRASRASTRQLLLQLPVKARAGGEIADAMMRRCALAILGRIRTAFIAKARGGTDEAGDSWQPLSPKTIAYSRRGGRTKAEKKRESRPSQALNAKQQVTWWDVYRRQLAIYKGNRGHAAAVAWLVLKGRGAKTLLDKYDGRKVEILRDTGLLLNSLSPATASPERILRIGHGEVIVGTNRKGAMLHHEGVPGRLPQRRLWPDPRRWPPSWWADVMDQAKQGILDLAASMAKSNTQ